MVRHAASLLRHNLHHLRLHSWLHHLRLHSRLHHLRLHTRLHHLGLHSRLHTRLHTWLHTRLHTRLHAWLHTRLHPRLTHLGRHHLWLLHPWLHHLWLLHARLNQLWLRHHARLHWRLHHGCLALRCSCTLLPLVHHHTAWSHHDWLSNGHLCFLPFQRLNLAHSS